MRVLIHPHAFKHGLSPDQILAAFTTGIDTGIVRSRDRNTDPPRFASIGFDNEGRAIEFVCAKLVDETVLIFHANYLTAGFRKEYRNGIHRSNR
ncbi:hypothetical protein J2S49_000441 [Arcanobacterium wilhelmae]|uniref:DUF4258 domain-containing protein n=1 Tax=Arcanobacterium wilhelmae TaxID=1803177 RepID=A0ABT9N9J0_9ACTO|nr:hypothetical protein [Arcanobacterium wilhelmae]